MGHRIEQIQAKQERKIVSFLFISLLIATILIRYAEPTQDGDIFFHLVYGNAIVDQKTMTPDHTVYSWTESINDHVYCAWLGQLIIYVFHKLGGLELLFFLKYLCLFIVFGIVWPVLKQYRLGNPVFPFLMLLIVSVGAYSGMYIKPEIISMVFMALLSFLYFQAKLLLFKDRSYQLLFVIPLLILIWVNTHGVWIFGFILFSIILSGEVINKFMGGKTGYDPSLFKYLSISYLATVPALFVNPYGWHYAIRPATKIFFTLFPNTSLGGSEFGISSNPSYGSIFTTIHNTRMHLIPLWVVMIAFFLVFFVGNLKKRQSIDWAILLGNIALCFLFTKFIRATYYWGPFWCMSIVYFSRHASFPSFFKNNWAQTILRMGMIILFLFFSLLSIYVSIFKPYQNRWVGFGLNNGVPIDESAFLRKHKPGKRLFNSYKTGGYLMYDLYPDYKIFVDARRFPYPEVLPDYLRFIKGETDLQTFNTQYPFDVALVDHTFGKIFFLFFNSEEWHPIYYGSTATVFVKQGHEKYKLVGIPLKRFNRLRNLEQANRVFSIALNFKDMDAAEYIYNIIDKKFKHINGYKRRVSSAGYKLDGLIAYHDREYDQAFSLLSKTDDKSVTPVTQALLHLRVIKCKQLAEQKKYYQALGLIEKNLELLPAHPDLLYAAGVLAYFGQGGSKGNSFKHRKYLNQFIDKYPEHQHVKIAQLILANQRNISIPLGL